jgi:hypothetical protein
MTRSTMTEPAASDARQQSARELEKETAINQRLDERRRRRSAWVEGRARGEAGLASRVARMLADDGPGALAQGMPGDALAALDAEIVELAEASRQQRIIRELAEQRAGREAGDKMRPTYARDLENVYAAMRTLSEVLRQAHRTHEQMRDEGADERAMPFEAGNLDDPYSAASLWVKDARAHGLLK